ncbi:MAG: 2-phosphosulfolactate phosphatase [Candidatus Edwardsbacteria bacterium]|nr:2-phosphosulfolactate phosphatase [Candidatus Edwardsbacteria bacterium]
MQCDVVLVPAELAENALAGRAVAVIDVLRASTSIVAALDAGARDVVPTASVEEATKLAETLGREHIVLCGERDGMKINGFDLGNSPLEFTEAAVKNKTLVMATTNGTASLSRAKPSALVCAACINNASAAAQTLVAAGQDITLVCSGKLGRFALEDAAGAGMIVSHIAELCPNVILTDSAAVSLILYQKYKKNLVRALKAGEHGQYLKSLGFAADLEYAARESVTATVPVLKDGRIVKPNTGQT